MVGCFVADQYKYWGYGWNENNVTLTADYGSFDNYIACVCMVRNGQAEQLIYNKDLGGARQRTAMGRYADGRLWLYCDKTGKTPEQLQQSLWTLDLNLPIMLDGGGSTHLVFPSQAQSCTELSTTLFLCLGR